MYYGFDLCALIIQAQAFDNRDGKWHQKWILNFCYNLLSVLLFQLHPQNYERVIINALQYLLQTYL